MRLRTWRYMEGAIALRLGFWKSSLFMTDGGVFPGQNSATRIGPLQDRMMRLKL